MDSGVDLVFECSGAFRKLDELQRHLDAGASQVIVSAPPNGDGVPVVVNGVTPLEKILSSPIVSAAREFRS